MFVPIQADRLMFALHLVHGMHPELFEAQVINCCTTIYLALYFDSQVSNFVISLWLSMNSLFVNIQHHV